MLGTTLISLYALAMAMGFMLTIIGAVVLAAYGLVQFIKGAMNSD